MFFSLCINQMFHLLSIRILNLGQIERRKKLFDPKHNGFFSLYSEVRGKEKAIGQREKKMQFSIWHHLANRFRRSGFYFYLFARQPPSSIHGIALVISKFHGLFFVCVRIQNVFFLPALKKSHLTRKFVDKWI